MLILPSLVSRVRRAAEISILVQSTPKSQLPSAQLLGDLEVGNWVLGFVMSGVTVAGFRMSARLRATHRLRFTNQDFHTCGKHCGKTLDPGLCGAENANSRHVQWGESLRAATFRA